MPSGSQWAQGTGAFLSGIVPQTQSGTTTSNGSSTTQTDSTMNGSSQSQLDSFLRSLSQLNSGSSTTPTLTPEHQQLINSLIGKYGELLRKPFDTTGYQTLQTQGINNNSTLQKQAVDNIMASRGLASSPVAATSDANIEAGRISQINSMAQNIPMLQQQMQQQNLQGAIALAGAIPHGTTTSGFQTQSGSQTGSQSGSQSQFATNSSQQKNENQQTQTTKAKQGGFLGNLLSGAGAALGFLFP